MPKEVFRDLAWGNRPWDRIPTNTAGLDLGHCLVPPHPTLWLGHLAGGGFCFFVMVVNLPHDAGICV